MTKKFAVIGATAGLAAGSLVAVALLSPDSSSAQGTTTTTVAGAAPSTTAKGSRIASALAPLVANGTITQAQADAVEKALTTRPAGISGAPDGGVGRGRHGGGFGPGGFGPGRFGFGVAGEADAIAKVLGMSAADLQTALRSGQSLADVAKARNVDVQKVIDQLVTDVKARADAAVAAGRITRAQADALLSTFRDRASQIVNAHVDSNHHGGHGSPGTTGSTPTTKASITT